MQFTLLEKLISEGLKKHISSDCFLFESLVDVLSSSCAKHIDFRICAISPYSTLMMLTMVYHTNKHVLSCSVASLLCRNEEMQSDFEHYR